MHLSNAEIRGYRSLRDVSVPFGPLTMCIGPNGSGKSSLLGALSVFFNSATNVDPRDYWCGDDEPVEEISIRLTFSGMTEAERNRFGRYLGDSGDLTVERRFEQGGSARYIGRSSAVRAFVTIRMLGSGHRDAFNELVDSEQYEGLERATSKAGALEKMRAWEGSHPERCDVLEVDFDEIQALLDAVNFISVQAFENPADHVAAQGKGAIAQLLAKVIDDRAMQGDLEAIAREATEQSQAYLRSRADDLAPFSDAMREQLDRFAPGFNVNVKWTPPTVQSAKPKLEVSIESEDGLERPLEYQGQGVQRALMYAALTAQVEAETDAEHDRVLLVIEEPEAFQHPLSCRVLSGTLRALAERHYQVIYSTHSPYFVHPAHIDGLRIFRRDNSTDEGACTHVESLDEKALLQGWQDVFELEEATITSVLTRLQQHLPPDVLEGLFARVCVLVEGQEDEAVLRAAAAAKNLDLDAAGIAVISTRGKAGMPNVSTFFSLADVQVYPIFDLDRQKDEQEQHRRAERQIMRSIKIEDEPVPGVGARYAAWQNNISAQLSDELGPTYGEAFLQAAEMHGYSVTKGQKVPAVVLEMLRIASASGAESKTLRDIGDMLVKLIDS